MDRRHRPAALAATPAAPPQARVDVVGDRVTAELPATGETVAVLLTGATVVSWRGAAPGPGAAPEERLWLSEAAVLDGSKAVRGGIPVVFPVFGTAAAGHAAAGLPQHGLARTARWEFLGQADGEDGTLSSASVQLDFGLAAASADPALRARWPFDFALLYRVTLAPGRLATSIVVTNEGDRPLDFQVLLHTYLRVEDIATTAVDGLAGAPYVDKVDGAQRKTQAAGPLAVAGETDRVYSPAQTGPLTVRTGGVPRLAVARDNLADVVVWNPWTAKAAAMGDFAPKDGFRQMLCVEPGAVAGWTTLEPGEAFEGGQGLTLL